MNIDMFFFFRRSRRSSLRVALPPPAVMDTAAIESLLAQISSAQSTTGVGSGANADALTQAILSRLNEEVSRYAGAEGAPADSSPARSQSGVGVRRPAPVELWRAAHEGDKEVKPVRGTVALAGAAAHPPCRVFSPPWATR